MGHENNSRLKNTAARRGFSLAELTIVMGVAIVVIAAVWMGTAMVHRQRLVGQAADEIWEISRRIRSAYAGQPNAVLPTTAAQQITAGFFPAHMISGGQPRTPWGLPVTVSFDNASSPRRFSIAYDFSGANSRDACVKLISTFPANSSVALAQRGKEGEPVDIFVNGATTSGGTSVYGSSPAAVAAALGAGCSRVRFVFFW